MNKVKIFLDNVNLNSNSGPNNFAKRLKECLTEKDHSVYWSESYSSDYDVSLSFINRTKMINDDRPNILRIDGIWFKQSEIERGLNSPLEHSWKNADAVIVQSLFDKKMIESFFHSRENNNVYVIRNGIETKIPKTFEVADAIIKISKDYEYVFTCSSCWHGQKRLKENIKIFQTISSHISNSCLIVMGQPNESMVPDKRIFYTGQVHPDICRQVFSISSFMIHSAWLDHCPNVVLESLAARTPVICTNSGGTHEILRGKRDVNDIGIGKNGIVLPDEEYNFKPMNYDDPPKLSDDAYSVLLDSIDSIKNKSIEIDTSVFELSNCVDDYIKVMKSVVHLKSETFYSKTK